MAGGIRLRLDAENRQADRLAGRQAQIDLARRGAAGQHGDGRFGRRGRTGAGRDAAAQAHGRFPSSAAKAASPASHLQNLLPRLGHGQRNRTDRQGSLLLKLVEQLGNQRNAQAGLRRPARIGQHFAGRAFLLHASAGQHADAIGQHRQQIDAVGSDNQRGFLPTIELQEQLDHLRFAGRIQAGRRFVQQQQARLHGQHARQAYAFLLAIAEMVDRAMTQFEGLHGRKRLVDAGGHFGLG